MNELHFKILNSCSGKFYDKLIETYGKLSIDYLIQNNYIVLLKNGVITRTEEGLNISKPLDLRETILSDNGKSNLLVDSNYPKFNNDNQLNS